LPNKSLSNKELFAAFRSFSQPSLLDRREAAKQRSIRKAAKQRSIRKAAKMNCIIESSKKNAYHTFTNTEFSGVIDIKQDNCNYHLFIRYEEKVYMEVKGVGEVVIPFAELQKNKYWKYYYDLSLMLANDKNTVAQELRYNSDYMDYLIYETTRYWWIDNAFIVGDEIHQYGDRGIYEKATYYNINPLDLEKMEYTSQEALEAFLMNYMSSSNIEEFERRCFAYNNLAIEHQTKKMEEMIGEIDELAAYFNDLDDKKNVANLVALYDNKDMNRDLLMMIYNNLVGDSEKYYHLVADIG
jgi:hypothetical protein